MSLPFHRSRDSNTDRPNQINNNDTLPVTISEVRILQAKNTRRGFLQRIVKPLLKADKEEPFTLREAREEIAKIGSKLEKLGMDILHCRTTRI